MKLLIFRKIDPFRLTRSPQRPGFKHCSAAFVDARDQASHSHKSITYSATYFQAEDGKFGTKSSQAASMRLFELGLATC
jgi:hypothetical protein